MLKTKNLLSVLVWGIIISATIIIAPHINLLSAQTPNSGTLTGWAWSANIGWIKFDSSYGSRIEETGDFAGYAWSPTIGWIDLSPNTTPPSAPNYGLRVVGTNVLGWARACNYFASSCAGAPKADIYLGGWDGWIKFGGGQMGSWNGVTIGLNEHDVPALFGFAWGSEVLGWVKFDGVWNGPNCTGVCLSGELSANCSVEPVAIAPGETATFSASVSGGVAPYSYAWSFVSPGQNIGSRTGQAVAIIPTAAGTVTADLTVTDAEGTAVHANQCATLTVSNDRTLTVRVEGNGSVSGNGISVGADDTEIATYEDGDMVTLTATANPGANFTGWSGSCTGTDATCTVTMNQNRDVTAQFSSGAPPYCIDVSYLSGNSMRVSYQEIRNLDEPHNSTKARVAVNYTGQGDLPLPSVQLSLNLNPLTSRSESNNVPELKPNGNSFSVPVGGVVDVWIHYPDDGQPVPNLASPYSRPGNYRLSLTAPSGVMMCSNSNVAPYLNATYIDNRIVEQ